MDALVNPPALPVAPTPEQIKAEKKMALIMSAIALLRQDKVRGFRIDIETDSTVQGNAEQEKEQRTAFIAGVTKFIETSAQVTAQVPEFAPLAAKMLQFGVRGFRVGRDLESAIEDFSEKAEQHAKQMAAQGKPPSPDQIKAQSEQMKAQAEIQRQQVENQGEQRNAEIDFQSKQMDYQIKLVELEIEKIRSGAEIQKIQQDHALALSEHQMKNRQHEQKIELMEAEHKHAMSQVGKKKEKSNG